MRRRVRPTERNPLVPGRRTGERLILAHLSNPRLGLRLFPREERGVNLRERDLSRALRAATRETIRLQPDLVLVTGDVFDGPHPTPGAITALGSSLEALLRGLPGVPVFLVAGVRDTPLRPAEPGPLEIFASLPGVSVAGATARAQFFDDMGLNVLLLPHRSVLHSPFPAIRPREEARWNVLAVQGEPGPGPGPEVDPSQWDYMAVGLGSHIREWSPGVLQAGALARTDPEPWWHTGDPEPGFVTFDLDSGEHQFHPLPDRTVVHLTVMPAGPSTTPGAPDLARTLEDVPGGPDGKILHLSIPGRRPAENHLDVHRSLAQVRARAAHLQISWNDGRSGKRPSTEAMPAEPDLSSVRAERLIRRGEVGGERSDLELPAGVCALVARDPPVRRELLRVLSFGLAPLDHGPRGAPSLGTTL